MKTNLILTHGAIGSSSQFIELKNALSDTFNVFVFDFEGHGNEAFQHRPFKIENFSDNLESVIVKNRLQPADIFGYSMGGYVALYLASTRPELINRIYTLATKFEWTAESAKRETEMLSAEKIEMKLPHFAALLERRHIHGWKENLLRTKQMIVSLGENPVLNKENMKNIISECRISVGDSDKMVSKEESKMFASFIQKSEVKILQNTEHPIEKTDLSLLVSEIKDFLHFRQ